MNAGGSIENLIRFDGDLADLAAFPKGIYEIVRDKNAALMLWQALWWQKFKGVGGWFYMTREEWQSKLFLTRSQQERARKILKKLNLLKEAYGDIPRKLYFQVNVKEVERQLDDMVPGWR